MFEQVKQLCEQINSTLAKLSSTSTKFPYTFTLPYNNSLATLTPFIKNFPLFYWNGENKDSIHFLTLGKKQTFCTIAQAQQFQEREKSIVLAALPYPPQKNYPDWGGFKTSQFWQPKILITQDKQLLTIIVNDPELIEYSSSPATNFNIQESNEYPHQKQWQENVKQICQDIKNNYYQKLVLSRFKQITLDNSGFHQLTTSITARPSAYTLFWANSESEFFLSYSPETLFKIEQQLLTVDSLAGSAAPNEPLHTDKNLEEHRFVTQFLQQQLEKCCSKIQIQEPEKKVELPYINHLKTTLKGELHCNFNLANLIQDLHPTPAIGGVPKELAQQNIARFENFDRGLYSAPIGYLLPERIEFLVAIRSVVGKDNKLFSYAGAGIIADSNPQAEWEETKRKLEAIGSML